MHLPKPHLWDLLHVLRSPIYSGIAKGVEVPILSRRHVTSHTLRVCVRRRFLASFPIQYVPLKRPPSISKIALSLISVFPSTFSFSVFPSTFLLSPPSSSNFSEAQLRLSFVVTCNFSEDQPRLSFSFFLLSPRSSRDGRARAIQFFRHRILPGTEEVCQCRFNQHRFDAGAAI
jgi:hypothetical protein